MPSHTHSIVAMPTDSNTGHAIGITFDNHTAISANFSFKPDYVNAIETDLTLIAKATGGSQAHNHAFTGTAKSIATMPPYIVVNVWKRTA